jgi:molecular chaperone DnaJ
MRSQSVCNECGGEGTIPEKPCKECKGKGYTRQTKELEIKVPGGIADGQTIRLAGQGQASGKGVQAGDLFVTINVKNDPKFKRDGYDIHTTAEISLTQAVLGTEILIETLDGEISLKIPAGTQSGAIFKISGKGMMRLQSAGRGDHLVKVEVKIPKKLSRKAKKLLEELSSEGV